LLLGENSGIKRGGKSEVKEAHCVGNPRLGEVVDKKKGGKVPPEVATNT